MVCYKVVTVGPSTSSRCRPQVGRPILVASLQGMRPATLVQVGSFLLQRTLLVTAMSAPVVSIECRFGRQPLPRFDCSLQP